MTQEEVRKFVDAKAMEDLIVKQSNLSCDIFQKGFENGFNFGCKFAIDKACEWLERHTPSNYTSNTITFVEQFKKAIEEL